MSTHHPHRPTRRRLAVFGVVLAVAACSLGLAPPPAGAQSTGADLSLVVAHAPSSPMTGDEVTFTITASNAGPGTAVDVVVGLSLGYTWRHDQTTIPENCGFGGENPSVICTVGAVAPGASATVTVTAVPLMAGVYVLSGAVASDTPDPDMDDRSATDTIIVRPGPTRYERAVAEIYGQVLGRSPKASEVDFWSTRWETAGWDDRHRVPMSIIASPESGRHRIGEAYSTMLGRPARAGDLAFWSAELTRGRPFESFEAAVIGAPEFVRHAGGGTNAAVQAAFAHVLGRPASGQELAAWTAQVDGGVGLASVATQLQRTTEARDRVIARRVKQVLQRAPHDFDRLVWLSALAEGSTHDEQWAMLYGGSEFLDRFPYDYDYFESGGGF